MSIRPIDFNGMIQNTQSLSHSHANEEHRPMLQQDNAQQTIAQEVELSATQVQEQEDAGQSQNALDADREGRGDGYRGNGKKKKKKKEKVSDGKVSIKAKHMSFDIKI
ncbi:MAG: hypothetical protein IJ679_02370 [Lachnospiraceae bacterium]|nr:hypothetical protein [Lachnospiraceae bacterium]